VGVGVGLGVGVAVGFDSSSLNDSLFVTVTTVFFCAEESFATRTTTTSIKKTQIKTGISTKIFFIHYTLPFKNLKVRNIYKKTLSAFRQYCFILFQKERDHYIKKYPIRQILSKKKTVSVCLLAF
jgi:hypothetical protein